MLLYASAALALLHLHGAQGHAGTPQPRAAQGPAVPPGCTSLFFDDFGDIEAGCLPSESNWMFDLGTSYPGGPANWGNAEAQSYTKDTANIVVTNQSTLRITPLRDDSGQWTSARIETLAEFGCPPGHLLHFEARIRLGDEDADKQLGIWPAFWALGSEFRNGSDKYLTWPEVGEVDILESLNGLTKVWQVIHCGKKEPGGPCFEWTGRAHTSLGIARGEWHNFTLEIDCRQHGESTDESMNWYIDGVKQQTQKKSEFLRVPDGEKAWSVVAGNPKMVLLNVAVGGNFPNAIAGRTTPTAQTIGGERSGMEVDYVLVYQSEASPPVSSTSLTTTVSRVRPTSSVPEHKTPGRG